MPDLDLDLKLCYHVKNRIDDAAHKAGRCNGDPDWKTQKD